MTVLTGASILSWLVISLIILSMNEQVEGFFGIFRRRQSPQIKSPIRTSPESVRFPSPSFPPPSFPPRGGMNFLNPFSNTLFPGFQNAPSFGGGFQAFRPRPPTQQWFPPNVPSQPLSQQSSIGSEPNFEMPQGFDSEQNFESGQMFGPEGQNFEAEGFGGDRDVRFDDQPPAINTEEAESFFTLLAETDENKCISRLVCEMGADPGNAGELGTTVSEIIGSLTDFPPGSKVTEYNEILRKGRAEGLNACISEFSTCDEETYKLMKSNAPGDSVVEGANMSE